MSQILDDVVTSVSTTRNLNESAIKDYALECSKRFRANKFTRVGSEFLEEIEADVESFVRAIGFKYSSGVHPPLYTQAGIDLPAFVTGNLMNKVKSRLNEAIARIVQEKVQRQPTVGKTLSRTR